MNPYDYFIDNGTWKISKNRVFIKKLAWVPILDIEDDHVNIFFDASIAKHVVSLIKKIDGKENFYLISPILSNPSYKRSDVMEINRLNIENYLNNYCKESFFDGFKKIGFDFVDNIVKYCTVNNCMYLLKEYCDSINNSVQRESFDWWSNRSFYNFREDIRDEFNGLYRQIKLSEILSR